MSNKPDIRIPKWRGTRREISFWVMIAGILASMYIVYYVNITRPSTERFLKYEKELSDLEYELQELQEIADNIELFEKKVEFLKTKIAEKRLALPSNPELPDLLKKLRLIGEKTGVRSIALLPKRPRPFGCYTLIDVNFKIEGTAEILVAFFQGVQDAERLINVQELFLFRPGPEPHDGVISATGTFAAYSFKDPKCVERKSHKWELMKLIFEE